MSDKCCAVCGEVIYEADIANCELCDKPICKWCVGDINLGDIQNNDGTLLKEHCPFCSGELVHNDDLLQFMLEKAQLTREEAEKMYKEKR